LVGDNYVLLRELKEVVAPTEELTAEQLTQLLSEMGGIDRITLNLVKNAFDSL
jgi:hypothetical protein